MAPNRTDDGFNRIGVFVRSALNYDRNRASEQTEFHCNDEEGDLAKQEFKDEVDINTLLRRFAVTGELPSGVRAPTYGDFSGVHDFHTAANALAEAREAFDEMPAEVRRRFNNDPARFVDFCSDEKNRVEAQKMGLVLPDPPAPATPPEPISGASAPGGGEGEVRGDGVT